MIILNVTGKRIGDPRRWLAVIEVARQPVNNRNTTHEIRVANVSELIT